VVELELYHPEVAYRSCEFCKDYVHNEETGEPVRNIRTKELLRRTKLETLPCIQDTCPKGHYSKPIAISRRERRIIDLYRAAKATGGAILTEAERRDSLVARAFSILEDVFEQAKTQAIASNVASIVLASKSHE
jgi:hypothetical protein